MGIALSLALFLVLGVGFVLVTMLVGSLLRPKAPNAEKLAVYECGEQPIGSSWVQFDLRFYIVALVFLVFDVEVALFYPWAVAYGAAGLNPATVFAIRQVALVDMLFFFGVLLVGFAYLWRFGYLDWVRSAATSGFRVDYQAGTDLSREARVDGGI